MTFLDKLRSSQLQSNSVLCVGLDPDPARLPVSDVAAFCKAIIEATAEYVCCYKPNAAFFEQLGPDGWNILVDVCKAIPDGIPLLLDAKRGDIGSTAEAYARACYDVAGADAVTLSPYLGRDTLEPFLRRADRTAFILCRTSNEGSGDLQDLPVVGPNGTRPLYQVVAERCRDWNTNGNVGLVVGATYPRELSEVRAICPDQPILAPGVGAQAGDVAATMDANGNGPIIVNASRGVLYASKGGDYAQAAGDIARELRDSLGAPRWLAATTA